MVFPLASLSKPTTATILAYQVTHSLTGWEHADPRARRFVDAETEVFEQTPA
jgi:hypothetical protein